MMNDTTNFAKWIKERRDSNLGKLAQLDLQKPEGMQEAASLQARCFELDEIERDLRSLYRRPDEPPINPDDMT